MTLCPKCWNAGRSLLTTSCYCNGQVLKPSEFFKWMGTKLVPLPEKVEWPKPVVVAPKAALPVFGEAHRKR